MSTLAWTCSGAQAMEVKVAGRALVLSLEVKNFEGAASCPVYSVTYRDRFVIAPSRLGLAHRDHAAGRGAANRTPDRKQRRPAMEAGLRRAEPGPQSLPRGGRRTAGARCAKRFLYLALRAYDEGAAFCYTLSKQPGLESVTIGPRVDRIPLPGRLHRLGDLHGAGRLHEGADEPDQARLRASAGRSMADDIYAAIAEARLVDYARMKLSPLDRRCPYRAEQGDAKREVALPSFTAPHGLERSGRRLEQRGRGGRCALRTPLARDHGRPTAPASCSNATTSS